MITRHYRASGLRPQRDRNCRAVRDAGRHVDDTRAPQPGDPCPLCGRPIACLGLTKCDACAAGFLPHGPRLWRKTKPWGFNLEVTCDSMAARHDAGRLAGRDAGAAQKEASEDA